MSVGLGAINKYREGLPAPWGKRFQANHAEPRGEIAMAMGHVVTPAAGSPGLPVAGAWLTGERNRFIKGVPDKTPRAVRLHGPGREDRKGRPPDGGPMEGRVLKVKQFVPGGILVDEYLKDVPVELELHYENEPRAEDSSTR